MKKLTVIFALLSFGLSAQTYRTVSTKKIAGVTVDCRIKIEDNDTTNFIMLSFLDQKYELLKEYVAVAYTDSVEFEALINGFNIILKSNKEDEIVIDLDRVTLSQYFSQVMFKKTYDGYIFLSRSSVEKLNLYLESVKNHLQ